MHTSAGAPTMTIFSKKKSEEEGFALPGRGYSSRSRSRVSTFRIPHAKARPLPLLFSKKMGSLSFPFFSEEEGFEPPDGFPSPVFKTGAFGHSATLPLELLKKPEVVF